MPRVTRWSRRRLPSSDIDIDFNPEFELPIDVTRRIMHQTRKKSTASRKSTSKRPKQSNTNSSIIVLDDSDEECLSTIVSRSRVINENVTSKVDNFFKSSGLLSDDEDEPLISSSTASTVNPSNCDKNKFTSINEASSSTTEKPTATAQEQKVIMINDESNEICTREDIENYCKETEDILKNANAILEKFTGVKSQEVLPCEIEESQSSKPKVVETKQQVRSLGECPICYENLSEKPVMTTKCGHLFCKVCIERVAISIKKCPTCRKAVNKKNIIPIYI